MRSADVGVPHDAVASKRFAVVSHLNLKHLVTLRVDLRGQGRRAATPPVNCTRARH